MVIRSGEAEAGSAGEQPAEEYPVRSVEETCEVRAGVDPLGRAGFAPFSSIFFSEGLALRSADK
jgi:hypothetical protein